MKTLNILIFLVFIVNASCTKSPHLSREERKAVQTEIMAFMKSMESALENPSPEKYFDCFLHTDELAVATQGQLVTNPAALRDTINTHLAMMEKQEITTKDQKICVLNNEAAVLSAAKISRITFKNGAVITYPYALTLLIVKRDGKWKVAQIHN